MPIKNYTTTVPANRSIAEIQDALVKHGATGMFYQYEQGTRRIEALQFSYGSRTKVWSFLYLYTGANSSASWSFSRSGDGMRRSMSTVWRGAIFGIELWRSLPSMERRLWRCRRCFFLLRRTRRDIHSMTKC